MPIISRLLAFSAFALLCSASAHARVSSSVSGPVCADPELISPSASRAPANESRGPASEKHPAKRAAASEPDSNGVTVIQLDPSMPTDALKADGYDVRTLEEFNETDPWTEPSPKLRDRLFAESGIRQFVGRYDHLKKDMLFLRAQEEPLDELSRRYPAIPRSTLATLQTLINGEKGAQK